MNLAPHCKRIVRHLLGAPHEELSTKTQWRYGSKGSLAVEVTGDDAGAWFDHEAGAGGGLVDLICREKGGALRDAFAWLEAELGIKDEQAGGATYRITGTWVYRDRDGQPLYRVVRRDAEGKPKRIHQERYDPAAKSYTGRKGCMDGVRRVPYRLNEWRDCALVLIAEGERKVDALFDLGWAATCNAGGAGKFSKGFAPYFDGAHVVILPDNDQAGRNHARDVAAILEPVAIDVRILELPGLPSKGDVIDWIEAGGTAEQLRELIDAAPPAAEVIARWQEVEDKPAEPAHDDDFDAAADRLAKLKPADYDRVRREEAKRLGVRTSTLDHEVERRRPVEEEDDLAGRGKPLELPEPEPWPEPVDGAELLEALVAQITRFVVLSDHAAVANSLWVIHTHAHDAAFISPRLTALSPTKRCGKSSLFRVLARLARRPLQTSNISPAAMFRVIESANPTLFCDEMSSIGDPDRAKEIRGVVNSSHCRADAQVIRNVAVFDGYEPRAFSTWAPMALAYIRYVDDQIRDRSVIIPMQRKAPDQEVAQLRMDHDQGFGELARKIARWAADHMEELRRADPDVPRVLNDRAADNWRCLLAIADQAAGQWPERARAAAVALSIDADDEDTIAVELVRDLKVVFDTLKADRLSSEVIAAHLVELEGRPWAEFGRTGKPITKHQLAKLLRPFKISPVSVRLADGTTPKGYKRESFLELWDRYDRNATTPQPTESATFGDSQNATPESPVAFSNGQKPRQTAACGVVAFSPPGSQRNGSTIMCAHCHQPVDPGAGYSATGTGEILHNACVEPWSGR